MHVYYMHSTRAVYDATTALSFIWRRVALLFLFLESTQKQNNVIENVALSITLAILRY